MKEYTQLLFQELSLNQELKYEKELNNDFICLMISLQNKQREAKLDTDNVTKRQAREGMVSNQLELLPPYWYVYGLAVQSALKECSE